MAFTMFSLGALFAPLHGLFAPSVRPAAIAAVRPAIELRPAVFRNRGRLPRPLAAGNCRKPVRPLRVFRGAADAAAPAARMAISGTMDDVCAELDRLAALEA